MCKPETSHRVLETYWPNNTTGNITKNVQGCKLGTLSILNPLVKNEEELHTYRSFANQCTPVHGLNRPEEKCPQFSGVHGGSCFMFHIRGTFEAYWWRFVHISLGLKRFFRIPPWPLDYKAFLSRGKFHVTLHSSWFACFYQDARQVSETLYLPCRLLHAFYRIPDEFWTEEFADPPRPYFLNGIAPSGHELDTHSHYRCYQLHYVLPNCVRFANNCLFTYWAPVNDLKHHHKKKKKKKTKKKDRSLEPCFQKVCIARSIIIIWKGNLVTCPLDYFVWTFFRESISAMISCRNGLDTGQK